MYCVPFKWFHIHQDRFSRSLPGKCCAVVIFYYFFFKIRFGLPYFLLPPQQQRYSRDVLQLSPYLVYDMCLTLRTAAGYLLSLLLQPPKSTLSWEGAVTLHFRCTDSWEGQVQTTRGVRRVSQIPGLHFFLFFYFFYFCLAEKYGQCSGERWDESVARDKKATPILIYILVANFTQ